MAASRLTWTLLWVGEAAKEGTAVDGGLGQLIEPVGEPDDVGRLGRLGCCAAVVHPGCYLDCNGLAGPWICLPEGMVLGTRSGQYSTRT